MEVFELIFTMTRFFVKILTTSIVTTKTIPNIKLQYSSIVIIWLNHKHIYVYAYYDTHSAIVSVAVKLMINLQRNLSYFKLSSEYQ